MRDLAGWLGFRSLLISSRKGEDVSNQWLNQATSLSMVDFALVSMRLTQRDEFRSLM